MAPSELTWFVFPWVLHSQLSVFQDSVLALYAGRSPKQSKMNQWSIEIKGVTRQWTRWERCCWVPIRVYKQKPCIGFCCWSWSFIFNETAAWSQWGSRHRGLWQNNTESSGKDVEPGSAFAATRCNIIDSKLSWLIEYAHFSYVRAQPGPRLPELFTFSMYCSCLYTVAHSVHAVRTNHSIMHNCAAWPLILLFMY